MANEGAWPRDESELESAWDLLDNDSDVSDEVEEAEERIGAAEDADDSGDKDGDAGESTAKAAEQQNPEEDGAAAQEQKVAKEKKQKKGKAARAVKGFKKFVGGVFRPSGSKLKWDVDANVSLKATYESNVAEDRDQSEKQVPKTQKPVPTAPKKSPADQMPAKQKTVAPPKKPPDEVEETDEPSTSADAARIANLAAENEELRQRYRILLNMQENYNRNHEPICFCAFYSHLLSNLIYGFTE
uniref:Uncharacterized protein n=1 Tax=Anopheles atroparvus TaxID=41427 RepID=A0A182IU93_ANOAO